MGKELGKTREDRGTQSSDKLPSSVNPHDSAQSGCSYSFLDFTLDVAAERLAHGSTEIKLRPKSFRYCGISSSAPAAW